MSQPLVVTLRRGPSTDHGTFSILTFGATVRRALELPWRDNVRRRSCIPTGTYRCALVQSPRFGRVYGVLGVPDRSAILIHAANLAGDIDLGWQSQLEGCIAPFARLGTMQAGGRTQAAGLVSAPALRELMSWAAGRPFTLEVS